MKKIMEKFQKKNKKIKILTYEENQKVLQKEKLEREMELEKARGISGIFINKN